jgi:hypothetical protein
VGSRPPVESTIGSVEFSNRKEDVGIPGATVTKREAGSRRGGRVKRSLRGSNGYFGFLARLRFAG